MAQASKTFRIFVSSTFSDLKEDLKPKEGWPEDSAERSVTELEIIHGVLANPQMADHAFFYFRDQKCHLSN